MHVIYLLHVDNKFISAVGPNTYVNDRITGTWPTFAPGVTEEQAEQIVRLAVDSGINLFDLSEAHSGERRPKTNNQQKLKSITDDEQIKSVYLLTN